MQLVFVSPPVHKYKVAGLSLVNSSKSHRIVVGLRTNFSEPRLDNRQRSLNQCLVHCVCSVANSIKLYAPAGHVDQIYEMGKHGLRILQIRDMFLTSSLRDIDRPFSIELR